jgi:hypothetical protein
MTECARGYVGGWCHFRACACKMGILLPAIDSLRAFIGISPRVSENGIMAQGARGMYGVGCHSAKRAIRRKIY